MVVEEAVRTVFRRLSAHEEAGFDGGVFDEPVGERVVRSAADVPPDVFAGGAGGGNLVDGALIDGREGAPCVHGLDDGVGAVGGVVAGGHEQDFGEGLAEGLRAAFENRELVLSAFVEAVDVGVFEKAELLRLFIGGAEAVDGLLHLLFEAFFFDAAVEDVAEIEGGEAALLVETLDDVEVGGAAAVEVVVVDLVVRQEVGIFELHGVVVFLHAALLVVESERDSGRQGGVGGDVEVADFDLEVKRDGIGAFGLDDGLARVDAGGLFGSRAEAEPEGLDVARLDVHVLAAAEDGIRPPADVGDFVGRPIDGLDVADRVRIDFFEFVAFVVFQRRDVDRHVFQFIVAARHDGDLDAFPFVAGERQIDGLDDLHVKRHVLREDLDHGAGGSDEHLRVVEAFEDGVALEFQDGGEAFECFRHFQQCLAKFVVFVHREIFLGELAFAVAEAAMDGAFGVGELVLQFGHVAEGAKIIDDFFGGLFGGDERGAAEGGEFFHEARGDFRKFFAFLEKHDVGDEKIHVRFRALREEMENGYVLAVDGLGEFGKIDDAARAAAAFDGEAFT